MLHAHQEIEFLQDLFMENIPVDFIHYTLYYPVQRNMIIQEKLATQQEFNFIVNGIL